MDQEWCRQSLWKFLEQKYSSASTAASYGGGPGEMKAGALGGLATNTKPGEELEASPVQGRPEPGDGVARGS